MEKSLTALPGKPDAMSPTLTYRMHECTTKCSVLNRRLCQDCLRLLLLSHIPYLCFRECHVREQKQAVMLRRVGGSDLPLSERSLGRTSLSLLAERSEPEPVPSSLSSRSCFSASIALMASFALAAEFMCAGPASLLPTSHNAGCTMKHLDRGSSCSSACHLHLSVVTI